MAMRTTVAAAWPTVCRRYEGVTTWMYLDTKGLVTTGIGFLIDSVSAAQALPWQKGARAATKAEIETEWRRVKGKQAWKKYNGLSAVWRDSAVLSLPMATVDAKLLEMTPRYWAGPARAIPGLEDAPADAQLAILDEAWQNGTAFLNAGTTWKGTRAAALAGDWSAAASNVPGSGDRAERRKRFFRNAAAVVRLGLDRDVLWDATAPSKTTPPISTPTPTPTPEVTDVAKVKFRGGWTCSCVATSLPLVEQDMIRCGLIKQSIDIFQLGYRGGATAASKGTHDEGGCTDVAQRSPEHIKVWREWGWTMQDRSKAFPDDQHAHGWPYRCPHLAPDAEAQERDWDRKDAGLVGTGRVGGMWPIDDWKTAMKKRLAEIAEADQQKELELPTTAEVTTAVIKAMKTDKDLIAIIGEAAANADVVPNEFTGNPANEFVATKTALVYLSRQNKALGKQLDTLIARFPEPGATPPAV